ncbi:PREDICTED: cinnamoyl-CoA reductase-like SNL6 [Ipomoea nil]|uniref:cinnamoyl-CoA reductase-like SNL6 n=1 Tax=Ipomoea nil TaxID=35883 RepID=UPI000901B5B3|nr:PREDICTED: cinnamoyl-CoA reductase-like SNL6 [Ipomoea nil]
MGIVRPDESRRMEIEELRRMLLSYAGVYRRKDEEAFRLSGPAMPLEQDDKLVCVIGGVSYLGIAIVNQLLLRGYSVRILVDNEEDLDKLREMENSGEMRGPNNSNVVEGVMARLTEVEDLSEAFNGCRGVFQTAAFIDPAGLSGYSKSMAEVEVMASKNVLEACASTSSVRYCVLTSSLLTCIWQDHCLNNTSRRIDHESWSNDSICTTKKLWYALGKLRAERAAWEIAKETGLKLATICPGLITGPEFRNRNPTPTIAYLKGAREMYRKGLLATVDVNALAKAHVTVYEEMKNTAHGRYVCFNKVLTTPEEVENLARETGIDIGTIIDDDDALNDPDSSKDRIQLSDLKLNRLMSRTFRCLDYLN